MRYILNVLAAALEKAEEVLETVLHWLYGI
jgi:hypothetical protein